MYLLRNRDPTFRSSKSFRNETERVVVNKKRSLIVAALGVICVHEVTHPRVCSKAFTSWATTSTGHVPEYVESSNADSDMLKLFPVNVKVALLPYPRHTVL